MKPIAFVSLIALTIPVWSHNDLWLDVDARLAVETENRILTPTEYRTVVADVPAVSEILANAPHEDREDKAPAILELPMPNGTMQSFQVVYSPIMEPNLEARFPEIQTYKIWGVDDLSAQGRIDLTHKGFHAMILRAGPSVWIDPVSLGNTELYQVYERQHAARTDSIDFQCQFASDNPLIGVGAFENQSLIPVEGELREYRIAISTTFEYSSFHGGTLADVMAAIVTAMNRVNGIYERDLAIRMNIIDDNDQLIFLDSNDPFTNNSPGALINENQQVINATIGAANYDIGHNFSTGGGGLASLGVVCSDNIKARGITGLGNPIGDPFYVDFVAHELGHQWGGEHTFNGTLSNCGSNNRSGNSAYEPGSGSTIMAYAGICGSQNLQFNSDDFFHAQSLLQMFNHSRVGSGNNCAQVSVVNNDAPIVDAGEDYVIPAQTSFVLNGSAVDAGGTTPTFCWEQFDLGAPSPPDTDDGSRPIFRSFDPTVDSRRYFPKLDDLLNNTISFGESLPTTDRTLTFRLTVRDNNPQSGGVGQDEMEVEVDADSGPFLVTSPNSGGLFNASNPLTVTWDVANTDQAPVSTATVDIYLSLDGGNTYELLETTLPNTGTAGVQLPNVNTTTARLMVRGSNNIFFDITDQDFSIEKGVFQICYDGYETWNTTQPEAREAIENGRIDVADLIFCNFIQTSKRLARQ